MLDIPDSVVAPATVSPASVVLPATSVVAADAQELHKLQEFAQYWHFWAAV